MLVAVRAMAPVTGMPPNIGDEDVGDALSDEFDVGVVAIAGHGVGDHRRKHAFDGGQHGHGHGRGEERQDVIRSGSRAWRRAESPAGIPPNLLPMVSTGKMKGRDGGGASKTAQRWKPGMRRNRCAEEEE